jgi:2-dehydro-3-deoxyphosphogluconate aldolase/(4S)-4-hydroxy-2-oxoglutarate aldolase
MPTGGVESEEVNLREWFKTGVVAVGMGSKLITKEMASTKDYEGIKAATIKAMRLVKEALQNAQ